MNNMLGIWFHISHMISYIIFFVFFSWTPWAEHKPPQAGWMCTTALQLVTETMRKSYVVVVADTRDNLLIQCQQALSAVSRLSAKYTTAAGDVTIQARLIHVHEWHIHYLHITNQKSGKTNSKQQCETLSKSRGSILLNHRGGTVTPTTLLQSCYNQWCQRVEHDCTGRPSDLRTSEVVNYTDTVAVLCVFMLRSVAVNCWAGDYVIQMLKIKDPELVHYRYTSSGMNETAQQRTVPET